MENSPINKIKECIDNLENKNFNIYFFTIDTKGVPSDSLTRHFCYLRHNITIKFWYKKEI